MSCFLWQGIPAISGGVNNKPYRFLIDTGLNAVAISQKIQTAQNLPFGKFRRRITTLDYSGDAPTVTLKGLTFDQIVFSEVEATTLNLGQLLSPRALPDAPQGWLGTPALSAFQITLDTKTNTLLLDSPKAAPPQSDDAITLPLTMRNGRIFTRLTAPGAGAFLMLIDTGAPASILPLKTFDQLKLKPFKTRVIRLANRHTARAAQALLSALQIGSATLKNVSVVSIAPDDPKDFDPDLGLIGMDILGQYRVTINYSRLKMTLIPH